MTDDRRSPPGNSEDDWVSAWILPLTREEWESMDPDGEGESVEWVIDRDFIEHHPRFIVEVQEDD